MIYDVPNLYYYIDIQCSTLPSCSTTDSTNDGLSYAYDTIWLEILAGIIFGESTL